MSPRAPSKTSLDITVVIASRNRREELLEGLARHEAPVILLDNGSSDGTPAAVRAAHPQVDVVELGANHGACARNLGVARAATPFVAFADDDSWWTPGALSRAVQCFDAHPRLGVLAGRVLVGEEDRLDPTSADMATAPLGTAPDLPGPDVMGFLACGAIVRRAAFQAVGGFDPVVFFGGEEERVSLDLLAAGWGMAYVEDVVAHHRPSLLRPSSGHRARLVRRNSLLTAVMRRPWPVVGRDVRQAIVAGGHERNGALAAVPRVSAALRARQQVPADLERRLELLANAEARVAEALVSDAR